MKAAAARVGWRAFYTARGAVSHARSAAFALRRPPAPAGLRIFFYHRVTDERDELAVKPARFRRQMEHLAERGFRVVDVETAAGLLADGHAGEGMVGLSFDDAYLDNLEHAHAVLEKLGFSATIYVPTGVVDGTARFTWYERQPPLLSWEQIEELDRGGVFRFGAHTVTHPNLLDLDDDAARHEIVESKRVLEERLGREVPTFCYPAGLFGARERAIVADAGYTSAVSCEPGTNLPSTDRLALHRTQMEPRDALFDFRAKLGGGHDSPLPARAIYRRLRFGMRGPDAPAAS